MNLDPHLSTHCGWKGSVYVEYLNLCYEYDKKIEFLLFNNKDVERLLLGLLMFFFTLSYYIHIVPTYTDCIYSFKIKINIIIIMMVAIYL